MTSVGPVEQPELSDLRRVLQTWLLVKALRVASIRVGLLNFSVLTLTAPLLKKQSGVPTLSEKLTALAAYPRVAGDNPVRALVALSPAYLLIERRANPGGGRRDIAIAIEGITSAGRRAAHMCPSEDQGDALAAALLHAAERAGSPDEATKVRRTTQLLTGVTGEVVGQVTAAVVTGAARPLR